MSMIDTNPSLDQFVADVLRRAHEAAETVNDPHQARVILDLAQMFADDLAEADPEFDRLQFIEATIGGAA